MKSSLPAVVASIIVGFNHLMLRINQRPFRGRTMPPRNKMFAIATVKDDSYAPRSCVVVSLPDSFLV
jgi:hypothetical protein